MADKEISTTTTTEVAKPNKNPMVNFINDKGIQDLIYQRLGKRAGQFTTSLLSLVNSSDKISECTPVTVLQAALTAASMDLPINQNLGFAYIVPYKNNKKTIDENGKTVWTSKMEAQFQMGWKGFVQLAQRSGAFRLINTTEVREGEVSTRDRMTGEVQFNWIDDDIAREKLPVVGYLAYFELLTGFNKLLYMTKEQVGGHADRYSQAYKSRGKSSFKSPWETDFDLMAQKTVLKQLLAKYAPLSTELQEAVAADQSVIDDKGRRYVDNDIMEGEVATTEEDDAILDAQTDKSTGEIKDTAKK